MLVTPIRKEGTTDILEITRITEELSSEKKNDIEGDVAVSPSGTRKSFLRRPTDLSSKRQPNKSPSKEAPGIPEQKPNRRRTQADGNSGSESSPLANRTKQPPPQEQARLTARSSGAATIHLDALNDIDSKLKGINHINLKSSCKSKNS